MSNSETQPLIPITANVTSGNNNSSPQKRKRKEKKPSIFAAYESLTVPQLRDRLKQLGQEGLSRISRDYLMALLLYAENKEKIKQVKKQKVNAHQQAAASSTVSSNLDALPAKPDTVTVTSA